MSTLYVLFSLCCIAQSRLWNFPLVYWAVEDTMPVVPRIIGSNPYMVKALQLALLEAQGVMGMCIQSAML